MAFVRQLSLSLLLAGVPLLGALPWSAAAAETRFEVLIEAREPLRGLLTRHLEIMRWREHARMSPDEFQRLYRVTPREIEALAATEGFYDLSVDARLEQDAGVMRARFDVDARDPVRVSSVEISYVGALMQNGDDARRKVGEWRDGWGLAPGDVFRHARWEEEKRTLLRKLALDRYPLATIAASEARVYPERGTVDLVVVVDSGPSVRFGELSVEGLKRYPETIVRNLNPIRPGDRYSTLPLQEFQNRLLESGYFASVTVDAPAHPDGIAPVRVWVDERESRRIGLGIGYSTDTGARGQAEYRQLDFLGRGLQLGTRLKLETRAQSARADLFFPTDAAGQRDRLIAETERKDIQNTLTRKVVATAGRARRRGDVETDLSVGYILEEEEVAGIGRDTRMAVTGNWAFTLRRTDHPLFPQRGYLFSLQLGGAPGVLVADQTFFRTYAKAVRYFGAGDDGVLTLRAEVGAVFARGTRDVPSDYLFRTGGDQTVRGYAFQSLGVRQGVAVTGGRALAVVSAEYTRWLSPDWGAAVFYDAGNAADDFRGFRLAHGYGVGARWRSPVGPLNLDIAHGRDEGGLRLHFSVGLAF